MKSFIKILAKKKLKISFAESCTGGLLASSITSINGASKVFNLSSNLILILLIIIFVLSFSAVAHHIKDNENKDPKEVIIDEFIGQSIPIYLYEISHGTEKSPNEALIFYGICFVLFRFFDIAKPFPVNFFDKNFKNSFGVIMDDVIAGIYVVLSLICFMVLSSYFV